MILQAVFTDTCYQLSVLVTSALLPCLFGLSICLTSALLLDITSPHTLFIQEKFRWWFFPS